VRSSGASSRSKPTVRSTGGSSGSRPTVRSTGSAAGAKPRTTRPKTKPKVRKPGGGGLQ
jgi:hypothetical protein